MIYIRKLFTQDLRDGKQIAFPKEPSYDFFKFDYQNNEADRHIEFFFEPENSIFKQFEGKKIETRLYAAGSESRIDGELKAFIRDEVKIKVDDLVVFKSDGRTNNKFKFNVILKTDNEYPLYMKIIDSANHTLIETESMKHTFETIDKPHNRIIFGAPGTGKSNRLKKDCDEYFSSNVDIKESLINEIKNRPQDKDKEPWFNHIGIKYASYIYKRCEEETEGNLQLQWGVAQNELWKMKTAARATIDYNHAVLNDELKCNLRYERVTFYPNYSYAQFVGTYKPVQDEADEKQIKYEYVPGAFMRIYVSAKNNPSQNFLLLIEEINRANVAAVFGDVFQLLDRKSDGTSEYPVAVSEDIKKYLAKNGIQEDELSIPSNMYIWATMNSADQGVFPMDTAFKRRWEFEYIGINENEKEVENFYIPINDNKKVKWNELRKAINDKLIELGINEDKLLGPFFLNKTILENAMTKDSNFIKSFESKVLMYLFEDAAKMKVRQLFNLKDNRYIYSEICKKFENDGLEVFNFTENSKVNIENIESVTQTPQDELF